MVASAMKSVEEEGGASKGVSMGERGGEEKSVLL